MQLAQRALTLSLISGGRFTLGIGMSHRMVTEGMWGISWDRAVRQMREYLDGLQPLLAGEPADATGEFWTARGCAADSGAPAAGASTSPRWARRCCGSRAGARPGR